MDDVEASLEGSHPPAGSLCHHVVLATSPAFRRHGIAHMLTARTMAAAQLEATGHTGVFAEATSIRSSGLFTKHYGFRVACQLRYATWDYKGTLPLASLTTEDASFCDLVVTW